MTIEEAIKHAEEVAEGQLMRAGKCTGDDSLCDKYSSCMKCAEEHRQLAEWLKELKQLRNQTRWIPVSERLPDEYKRVIVSDVFGIYIGEFVDSEENWGGKHFINVHGMHSKSVAAWMPLPEQYKAESEDVE